MSDDYVRNMLLKSHDVTGAVWVEDRIIEISRKKYGSFQAAILKEKLVDTQHVEPFLARPVAVIANFPKIGKWTGGAIERCEAHGKAWGQWGVLLRALGNEAPETTENPEISFNRRALIQHTRVRAVRFLYDHLLLVEHQNGRELRIALLYEYDLSGDDVRSAWDRLGPFDILLKTNPNGSLLNDAHYAAEALGAKVLGFGDMLSYLARGKF